MSYEIARVAEIIGMHRKKLVVAGAHNLVEGGVFKCEKRIENSVSKMLC